MKGKVYYIPITVMVMACILFTACKSDRDFSNFTEFSYRLELEAIYEDNSFVIEEGMISTAEITRDENTYLLTMTVFRSGQPGTDECLIPYPKYGMDCIAERELETRELNADEIESVKAVFSTTTIESVFISAGTRVEAAAPSAVMAWDSFGASEKPPALGPSLVIALPKETVQTVTDLLLELK